MKYAVQIKTDNQPWVPGIHRFKTKKAASLFLEGLKKLDVKACLLRMNKNNNWEAA